MGNFAKNNLILPQNVIAFNRTQNTLSTLADEKIKQNDLKSAISIYLDIEKSGKYIVEIEFTSPLTSLAQIAINLNIDHAGAFTFVAKGTDGGVGIMKSNVSIMNWNKKIVFSSKADVTIKSVKFLIWSTKN